MNSMEWVFKIVEVFICVLEAYLMFDFYKTFFSLRECFQKKYVNVAAVVTTAVCVRLVNTLDSSTINIVGMQVIYLSLLFVLFVGKTLRKIFCYLIATAIMIGSELLLMIVLSHPSNISMNHLEGQSRTYIVLLGIKTLAFILFTITKRVAKKTNNKMDIKSFMLYSVLPLGTLGIMVALGYLNIEFDASRFVQSLLIVCNMLVVIGNILIFYVFDRMAASKERLRQQEVLITRMEMEEKRYEQIDSVNREHARLIHDIWHYMRTIGELAALKQNEDILDILSELKIKVSDAEIKVYCSNRMLNTILNEKKKEADKNGIKMKIKIAPNFVIDYVGNMDLIAIMGNLLDNAMEAAQQCKHGYINLELRAKNDTHFSVISIENNYVGEIITKGNEIITGKPDKTKHGHGIKNVDVIAQKYNGYLQNVYGNGVFTTIVVLPNPMAL